MRRSPSMAMASASGCSPLATYASRLWVSASMPVAAVTKGGSPTVSSGSRMAAFAIR